MSNFILAVDPGTIQCGIALFRDKVLTSVALAKASGDDSAARIWEIARQVHFFYQAWQVDEDPAVRVPHAWQLAIEMPAIRRSGNQAKANPDDILLLAVQVGAIIGKLPKMPTRRPKPSDWKGGVKKDPGVVQTLAALAPEERRVLEQANLDDNNNVVDAAGVGLWAARRNR